MEIKATLQKPYTEDERIEFIINQNHRQGYEIKETEIALEAWGYTQEEIAERLGYKNHSAVTKRLQAIRKQWDLFSSEKE